MTMVFIFVQREPTMAFHGRDDGGGGGADCRWWWLNGFCPEVFCVCYPEMKFLDNFASKCLWRYYYNACCCIEDAGWGEDGWRWRCVGGCAFVIDNISATHIWWSIRRQHRQRQSLENENYLVCTISGPCSSSVWAFWYPDCSGTEIIIMDGCVMQRMSLRLLLLLLLMYVCMYVA